MHGYNLRRRTANKQSLSTNDQRRSTVEVVVDRPTATSASQQSLPSDDQGRSTVEVVVDHPTATTASRHKATETQPHGEKARALARRTSMLHPLLAVEHGSWTRPPYMDLYDMFSDSLEVLQDEVFDYTSKFFLFTIPQTRQDSILKELSNSMSPQLVLYVSTVAVGGPNGSDGWKELFIDKRLRRAVVFGVIARTLREHVLMSVYFGADEEQEMVLKVLESGLNEDPRHDGFSRARAFADVIAEYTAPEGMQPLPPNLDATITEITLKLYTMLLPIFRLNPDFVEQEGPAPTWGEWILGTKPTEDVDRPASATERDQAHRVRKLWRIVHHAAMLSIRMRGDGSTVYHFPITPKDSEYNKNNLDCINRRQMVDENPYRKMREMGTRWLPDPKGQLPLVRVVCFPECVAYKRGGWAKGRGREWRGFRSKRLIKSLVALRWGKPLKRGSKGPVALKRALAKNGGWMKWVTNL